VTPEVTANHFNPTGNITGVPRTFKASMGWRF